MGRWSTDLLQLSAPKRAVASVLLDTLAEVCQRALDRRGGLVVGGAVIGVSIGVVADEVASAYAAYWRLLDACNEVFRRMARAARGQKLGAQNGHGHVFCRLASDSLSYLRFP